MGKYLDISEIKSLQIEPTSKCNLLCPQCAHTFNGKVNPLLPLTELTPQDYDSIFTDKLTSQLNHVIFNGNYGDPITSNHLNYAIDKLSQKKISLTVFTNGSLKSAAWWKDLGSHLAGTGSQVVFSIDGLEDTNHIYRVNSNFKKIMENAGAYIQAGGKARWDFLVFEHNQHQVEEAKALAKKIGFKKFHKKYSARFVEGHYTSRKDSLKIFNKKGNVINHIKEPSHKRRDFERVLKKYGSWSKYIDDTPIYCKFKEDRKALFIDFEALVWPCCWVGAPIYFTDSNSPQKKQFDMLRKKYKKYFNSLRHYSLTEILSHQWLDRDLVQSWKNKTTDDNSKLFTCARTCGTDYEFTSAPGGKNSQIVAL